MKFQEQIKDDGFLGSGSGEPFKPTVVLVHGAFEDASIWNGVIPRLQRDGYPAVAFANPLLGVAVDAAYLGSMVDRIQGSVILVAHSYGGTVNTQVGADAPNVKDLVYAAAVMPAAGEAASHLLDGSPAAHFQRPLRGSPTPCPTEPAARISSTKRTSSTVSRRCARERRRPHARHPAPHEFGSPEREGDIRCMDE
jgi:pimeloyl-ACP methyl ester carboxylesterase